MIFKKPYIEYDFTLLFIALSIFCIGLLFLYSATHSQNAAIEKNLVLRQIVWMFVGLIILALLAKADYQSYVYFGYILYGISILLLILVLFVGKTRYGANRWFSLGTFTFQPSEFAKPALILALASYIGNRKTPEVGISTILVSVLLTSIPVFLILAEPDLGTSLIMVVILFSMLFIGGARLKYLLIIIGAGLVSSPFLWHFLKDYQKQRLLVFLNPNADPLGAGYTIIQSKIAIGSGFLFGKGLLSGTQNQLNFLPERHTDFIFSVVGEEWGFAGGLILLALYYTMIKKLISVIERTNDAYGQLLGAGIVSMLTFQITINIAMTMGLMPVVGIPLPLISYGGSSLITTMASIGLVMNISSRRYLF